MRSTPLGHGLTLLALSSATAAGQDFDNRWLSFERADDLLVSAPGLGLSDPEEKDYAVGDFDKNGLEDLVVVRKEPLQSTNGEPNVLFLNLGGTLVDSTAQFATASDVPGDNGFLTRTNDRDVVVTDVDQDGWLDIVTATSMSPGKPKEVSHPRVYRNLGEDGSGLWQGFRYEAARIPQLLDTAGQLAWPRFTAVDAGDLTGDGFPDLYFGDNDLLANLGGGDLNERLLVNDGTGHFVDESALRMTAATLNSYFTTSVTIADLNDDGENDVVRNRGYFGGVAAVYNDPDNVGFFAVSGVIPGGSPYYTGVGDLNRDGRPDLVVSDNGDDHVHYNLSTHPHGAVQWSVRRNFDFLTGGDDGYASDNYVVDLDLDGWNDVLICDYDIELPGCQRRLHLYHNAGGTVGGAVTLREEAQQASGGWRGAVGLDPDELNGTHDVGLLDIDGDGDTDMVVGRCEGTSVYLNETFPNGLPVGTAYCFCELFVAPCSNPGAAGEGCENSTGRGATMAAYGSVSVSADDLYLHAEGMPAGVSALGFVGQQTVNGGFGQPLGDGLLCTDGNIVRLDVKNTTSAGRGQWGPGLAAQVGWLAGDVRRLQVWFRDPVAGPCGAGNNLTNAVQVTFTP